MSARIGVEIGSRKIRAVRVQGLLRLRVKSAEVECDADSIADAVGTLRGQLGAASTVGVAVDLPLLFAKRVKLPPLAAAEKRRILGLEPERFFPIRGEDLVLAVREEDNVVFATREAPLMAWLSALEALGRVELVEPAPVSLARALSREGVKRGTVLLDRNGGGIGVLELADARVSSVRRVRGEPDRIAAAMAADPEGRSSVYLNPWHDQRAEILSQSLGDKTMLRRLPAVAGAPDTHLAALGAALGAGGTLDHALVPADLEKRINGRRRRGVAYAVLALAAAGAFAVASLVNARARTLREQEGRVAAMESRAERVLAMQARLDTLRREARAAATLEGSRPDPLRVVRAISERLPRDSYLRSMRGSGSEWQITGYASDASNLVPIFEAAPEFEGVRFLTATTRLRVNNKSYDSFSLALRVVQPS